jgi:nitrate reductase NapE component
VGIANPQKQGNSREKKPIEYGSFLFLASGLFGFFRLVVYQLVGVVLSS